MRVQERASGEVEMSAEPLFDYITRQEKEIRNLSTAIGAERVEFKGHQFVKKLDEKRLATQIWRIFFFMRDSHWRTVDEIHDALGYPHNSIQANVRNLRKEKNGGHTVNTRRRGDPVHGLFEFQLIPNPEAEIEANN